MIVKYLLHTLLLKGNDNYVCRYLIIIYIDIAITHVAFYLIV